MDRAVGEALRRVREKQLLTTADVAELLSVNEEDHHELPYPKTIAMYRIGGRYLYKRDEVMAFIEHRKFRARGLTGLSGIKERSLKRIAV